MKISEKLGAIGFDEVEIKVYETLTKFGFRTLGQIQVYVKMEKGLILSALESLSTKGLIQKKETKSPDATIYIPSSPQISLSADIVKKLESSLLNVSSKVKEIWKETSINLDKNLSTLSSKKEEQVNNLKELNKSSLTEIENGVINLERDEKAMLNDLNRKMQTAIKDDINHSLNEIIDQLKHSSKTLENNRKNFQADSKAAKAIFGENLSELSQSSNNETLELIKSLQKEIVRAGENRNLDINGISENLIHKITSLKNEITDSLNQSSESYLAVVQKRATESLKEFETKIEYQETELAQIIETVKGRIEASIDKSEVARNKSKELIAKATVEQINSLKNSLVDEVTTVQTGLSGAIKAIQDESVISLSDLLEKASEDVVTAEANIVTTTKKNQELLTQQLDKLIQDIGANLYEKFVELKSGNQKYNQNLSESGRDTINTLASELDQISTYVAQFLVKTKSELENNLEELTGNVGTELEAIAVDSTEERNLMTQNTGENLEKLNLKTIEDINSYVAGTKSVLEGVKQTLVQNILNSQTEFNNEVENSLKSYREKIIEIAKGQKDEFQSIQKTSEHLKEKIKNTIQEFTRETQNSLNKIKEDSTQEFKANLDQSLGKSSDQAKRAKENASKEFKRFNDQFRSSVTGLRTNIPNKISHLFLNHQDKLDQFERKFSSFKRTVIDNLESRLEDMKDNPKTISKKKDIQKQKTMEQEELISTIKELAEEVEKFLGTSRDETKPIEKEVTEELVQTVQNETEKVEHYFDEVDNNVAKLVDEVVEGMSFAHDNYAKDFVLSSKETIDKNLQSFDESISEKFKGKIIEIVDEASSAIIGENQEGGELSKLQDKFKGRIELLIQGLGRNLEAGYTTTLNEIDNQINEAHSNTTKFGSDYLNQFETSLGQQLEYLKNFSVKMGSAIKSVTDSVMIQISGNITSTNEKVNGLAESKSVEIQEKIKVQIETMKTHTEAQLKGINDQSNSFIAKNEEIEEETRANITKTVSLSKKEFGANIQGLITTVKSIFGETLAVFSDSKNSLLEEVNKPLIKIKENIGQITEFFEQEINSILKQSEANAINIYDNTFSPLKVIKVEADNINEALGGMGNKFTEVNKGMTNNITMLNKEMNEKLKEQAGSHISEIQEKSITSAENLRDTVQESLEASKNMIANYEEKSK